MCTLVSLLYGVEVGASLYVYTFSTAVCGFDILRAFGTLFLPWYNFAGTSSIRVEVIASPLYRRLGREYYFVRVERSGKNSIFSKNLVEIPLGRLVARYILVPCSSFPLLPFIQPPLGLHHPLRVYLPRNPRNTEFYCTLCDSSLSYCSQNTVRIAFLILWFVSLYHVLLFSDLVFGELVSIHRKPLPSLPWLRFSWEFCTCFSSRLGFTEK